MEEFKFTAGQRQDFIAAGLKQFQADQTEVFLNEAQRITREWLSNYPARHGSNKEARERLELLAKQLDKTRHYMLLLPELARSGLACDWQHCGYAQKGWPVTLEAIELLLFELQRCATGVASHVGPSKPIETSLVKNLARAFVDTFRKRPTTSPDGPFIVFLDHLSKNVLDPAGIQAVFGKVLVSGVIKNEKKRLDDHDKFINR